MDGEYKILEITEITAKFPKKSKVGVDFVHSTSKFLSDMEMIDVRHSDEDVVAVAILPRGRIYKEEQRLQRVAPRKIGKGLIALIILGTLLTAVAGTVVAHLIIEHFFL